MATPLKKSAQPSETEAASKKPVIVDASQNLPDEIDPIGYLSKSRTLLDENRPESEINTFLLFSPLLPVLAFIAFSLSIIGFQVNNRTEQVAEIRSRADVIPCAQGSHPQCRYPGDSCGDNKLCVTRQYTQDKDICNCVESSPDAVRSVPYVAPEAPRSGFLGTMSVLFLSGVVLLFVVLIVIRYRPSK